MRTQVKRAFTLIEILIVVVILGILAAIVIPQFTDAASQANNSSVKSQLQTIRSQIELYRVKNNGSDPASLAAGNFTSLINPGGTQTPYLHSAPVNPLNSSSTVANAAAAGVGWVWRTSSANANVKDIYAVDEAGAELSY
jgi:general secretion pathway protein G